MQKRRENLTAAAILLALLAPAAMAQRTASAGRIDVEEVRVSADVNPRTQSIAAKARVRFTAIDDKIGSATFELHNAMTVTGVTYLDDSRVDSSRNPQDFSFRVSLEPPMAKGSTREIVVSYEGKLTGQEESPVYGIKFAALRPEYGFLMYPSRWFPVAGYTADRYKSEFTVTVPDGYTVVSGGLETTKKGDGKSTTVCTFNSPGFGGSLAIVPGAGKKVPSGGVNSTIYFRGESAAAAESWGEETGKVLGLLTAQFGLAPASNIALVETEDGAPNGYASPGMLFLSPHGIGKEANTKLLANQLSRHWYGVLTSPASRNHLWITNGMARYAELLLTEQTQSAGAVETEVRDTYVEALTIDNPPLIQASRLEDYSPEYWATTAAKGAAVYQMLRNVLGEDNFKKLIKAIPERFANKSISTDDVTKMASELAGYDLGFFFLQWIESSGAPQFKLEYTVYRTNKGFRIMGKIQQDLDTFRMPVDLKIETEGNPEMKRVDVAGPSSEFVVETFGKPKKVEIDPNLRVLRMSSSMRVAVAIRRGEMFTDIGEYGEALKEFQKALEVSRNSSLAHYRVADIFFLQNNYQAAANEFREVLNGDIEPKWTEVWAHINLGKIFDITGQRDRAVNEYNLAVRTRDNTQGAQEEAAKYLKDPYKRQRTAGN
ncbi:MAG: peptidase M1 [Acidobacteria bacterium]|nr:peptidase M1 [Acidobacteriota bacterium]